MIGSQFYLAMITGYFVGYDQSRASNWNFALTMDRVHKLNLLDLWWMFDLLDDHRHDAPLFTETPDRYGYTPFADIETELLNLAKQIVMG